MKPPKEGDLYFFVDEAGDPTFYNSRGKFIVGAAGCSSHLMLGLVRVKTDPTAMRNAIRQLQRDVLGDQYFRQLPSFAHTSVAFHANKDAPEVRYLVFKLIQKLNFKACFVVSQKDEQMFRKSYQGKKNHYYDDLIARLFQNSLHRYTRNHICIAARGSRVRQKPLETAIDRARTRFRKIHKLDEINTAVAIEVQSPKGEPCLSVVDYIGWAIQRAYTTGDMKFYRLIEDKIGVILELAPGRKPTVYCSRNPFTAKAAPL